MRLENKVALVAGGASGIGAAQARLFAREGARVVVADFDEAGGQQTAKGIVSEGGDAFFQRLDVTSAGQWSEAVEAATSRYDRLDVLSNCAGANNRVSFDEQTEEMWDQIMDTNAKECFLGIKAAVPAMRRNGGGSIVLVASMAGLRGGDSGPAYGCSKAAVISLVKYAARSYARDNIRVNSILPGHVDTPFLRGVKPHTVNTPSSDLDVPENYQHRVASTPLGRLASPEEIAYAALYLACDESSYVTGSPLIIDGGVTA